MKNSDGKTIMGRMFELIEALDLLKYNSREALELVRPIVQREFPSSKFNLNHCAWYLSKYRSRTNHAGSSGEKASRKPITMRVGNKGLTAKVNLWSLEKVIGRFDAEAARLWVKGQVTHADTGEVVKFTDPGELVTALARWNVRKYKELKRQYKRRPKP